MSYAGQFEFHHSSGTTQGSCRVVWDTQQLTVEAQSGGPAIAFDLGEVKTFVASDWDVTLTLLDGSRLLLHHFAKATSMLLGPLKEAWQERVASCVLASDLKRVNAYDGHVQWQRPGTQMSGVCCLMLFQTHLTVLMADGQVGMLPLGLLRTVSFDSATWSVVLEGVGAAVRVSKLGTRTDTFVREVQECLSYTRSRCLEVVKELLPGADRTTQAKLALGWPEGTLISQAELAQAHPGFPSLLLETAVSAGLRPYLNELMRRNSGGTTSAWYAGYKLLQRSQNQEEATAPGMARKKLARFSQEKGQAVAAQAEDATDRQEESGAGLLDGAQPDDESDRLGETLVWFLCPVLSKTSGPLIAWEATSSQGHATYLFKGTPAEIPVLNQALVGIHFRREPIYLETSKLASDPAWTRHLIADKRLAHLSLLRKRFHSRLLHTDPEAWAKSLESA